MRSRLLKLNPQDIELIIVATTSHSHAYPSAACQVQGLLNIDDAISFDLAAACTGFVYALSVADQFYSCRQGEKALVIGSDLNSRKLDETDRSTVVLLVMVRERSFLKRVNKKEKIETPDYFRC